MLSASSSRSMAGSDPAASAFHKITLRLIPFLFVCYVLNYVDRINVSIAHFGLSADLGFSEQTFGLGVGLFFVGYLLFEVPSNLLMQRIGARKTLTRIMVLWGLVSAAMMFIKTPTHFYIMRVLLGAAEAGFLPGVVLYLTFWFPRRNRAQATALFMAALPIAGLIGNPVSGWTQETLNGVLGLRGWQWLFLIEGLPTIVVGIIAFFYLDDTPASAKWLTPAEKQAVSQQLEAERAVKQQTRHHGDLLQALRDPKLYVVAFLGFATYCTANALSFWAPFIIRNSGVASTSTVGLLAALPSLTGLVAMVLVGRSSDRRLERRWHAVVPALVAVLGLALLPSFSGSPLPTVLILMLIGAGHFAFVSAFWTIPPTYLVGSAAAGGIAAIGALSATGGFLVPILLGWAQTTFGSLSAGLYTIVAVVLAAVIVLLVFIPASALREEHAATATA